MTLWDLLILLAIDQKVKLPPGAALNVGFTYLQRQGLVDNHGNITKYGRSWLDVIKAGIE